MEYKYHIVYKTTNLINQKIYIGVHSTNNLEDGYIGCGIKSQGDCNSYKGSRSTSPFISSVKKYGYKNFKREILYFFNTREESYNKEIEIVTEEFCNRKDTYNSALGGKGGYSKEGSKKISEKLKGRIFSPEWRLKISISKKGTPAWNKGIERTQEVKDKIRNSLTGRSSNKGIKKTDEHRRKLSEAKRGVESKLKGRKCSEEHIRKNSEAQKEFHRIKLLKQNGRI